MRNCRKLADPAICPRPFPPRLCPSVADPHLQQGGHHHAGACSPVRQQGRELHKGRHPSLHVQRGAALRAGADCQRDHQAVRGLSPPPPCPCPCPQPPAAAILPHWRPAAAASLVSSSLLHPKMCHALSYLFIVPMRDHCFITQLLAALSRLLTGCRMCWPAARAAVARCCKQIKLSNQAKPHWGPN